MPKDRLVLFVDWQNAYNLARTTFFDGQGFHSRGQFSPLLLGQRIAAKQVTRAPRVLTQVRVYRGAPNPRKDRKSAGAHQRQVAAWQSSGLVVAKTRALRYPGDWPQSKSQEKGIDVQLAIDLVAGYLRDDFDVGVVLSRDTDQVPALELACEIAADLGKPPPEVATWCQQHGQGGRLRAKDCEVRCHWLAWSDYEACKDHTDYNIAAGN